MSYSLPVKEESLLVLTYDVVPLQDLALVMNTRTVREAQKDKGQESASWEGACIRQNSAELHITTAVHVNSKSGRSRSAIGLNRTFRLF